MKEKHKSNKQSHHLGLILFLILLVILLGVLAVNYKHFASKQLNPVQTTQPKKPVKSSKEKELLIGAYRDDQDGAAVVFNENGTGRYVYADKKNSDTNDALTWRKDGDRYLITLKDKDVTNPLIATLDKDRLIISGSNGWNTETFQRTTRSLDLQDFLNNMHTK
ncbi:hypothetical protein H5S09_06770 [Limosilactobacillus sp. STM2_1]|uniref:DUF3642 domain-containing protein n=1 Tax=Limosilactobacillus rudii TaxID=2759755 RepID=A0A7W3UL78_9LACO|nr:lipocalin/fatty acid-binding family protein [Limosilactobacillus rudii]MBB1078806.1 hypothetical protein [Limosilactobacillus rudii]MBB1097642.1 hypothetical protein [Limosilactobacillus rudii]MCD7134751.1 lipocalin/fatty acid-binding family protein [Limosilactobacillus rudii]